MSNLTHKIGSFPVKTIISLRIYKLKMSYKTIPYNLTLDEGTSLCMNMSIKSPYCATITSQNAH